MTGLRTCTLALLLAAAGCGADRTDSEAPPPPPAREAREAPISEATPSAAPDTLVIPAGPLPDRPETLLDTLLIEGTPAPVTSRLVRSPRGFDLPFSTYLPPGINLQFQNEPDAAAARFVAAFGGTVDRTAYMHIRMYPDGTTLAQARNQVAGFLTSRTAGDDPADADDVDRAWQPADPPPWGLEAYAFGYSRDPGERYTGRVVLARHGPRLLHVLTHYPAEYGDGLAPRFRRILDHWRWEDTGQPL